MHEKVDPVQFGLSRQTVIHQIDAHHFELQMMRKSRIIMADAMKILTRVAAIQKVLPDVKVSLATSAPVCSKSAHLLAENGIVITGVG
ncbi:hypothetical protein ACFL6N_04705 [Thermodesulfobacteriota bacterium]